LRGGQPTAADTPTDTASTPTDTTDNSEGDGSEIIAVPSFDEGSEASTDATAQPTDTSNVTEGSSDAIVEVTAERIFTAAGSGSAEEINALAQAGADFNIRDDFGQTPLIYALNNGQAVVQALINQGANVNAQTDAGWTPLMYAARDVSGNVISVLLQSGADLGITNNDGQTAVGIAQATPGREGAAQIILDSQ
jgi:ankyrin repeat protein